jgi:hypothetical protein
VSTRTATIEAKLVRKFSGNTTIDELATPGPGDSALMPRFEAVIEGLERR